MHVPRALPTPPRRAGPVKAPKNAHAASATNQKFKAALGGMTRNVEMITAGKLVNEGRILRCVQRRRGGGATGAARCGASAGAALKPSPDMHTRRRSLTSLSLRRRSMDSLKKLADEQLDMVARTKKDGHSRVKAALDRKHVKGLRGVLDLEEMAQLVRTYTVAAQGARGWRHGCGGVMGVRGLNGNRGAALCAPRRS